NVAVMAFQSSPKEQNIDKLKKRADKLSNAYGLDFHRMLAGLKASNPNNGKHFHL
ncbi:polyamine aminopropyltransferase, partial [Neisseria gonorrhoeae]